MATANHPDWHSLVSAILKPEPELHSCFNPIMLQDFSFQPMFRRPKLQRYRTRS
ncbi:hypothetical protein NC651_020021 [Populus alba x Populus x berolinensis]|nr:hypothetical protein NC651_020021 [Populus alba x Populus x berolinensis]